MHTGLNQSPADDLSGDRYFPAEIPDMAERSGGRAAPDRDGVRDRVRQRLEGLMPVCFPRILCSSPPLLIHGMRVLRSLSTAAVCDGGGLREVRRRAVADGVGRVAHGKMTGRDVARRGANGPCARSFAPRLAPSRPAIFERILDLTGTSPGCRASAMSSAPCRAVPEPGRAAFRFPGSRPGPIRV